MYLPLEIVVREVLPTDRCSTCRDPATTGWDVFTETGSGTWFSCGNCIAAPGTAQKVLVSLPDTTTGRKPPTQRRRRLADRLELKVSHTTNSKKQPGSGNTKYAKGDVWKKGVFRIDAKTTTKKSWDLTRDDLNKIRGEAAFREVPALVIGFLNKFTGAEEDRWACIPWEDFQEKIANEADDDRRSEKQRRRDQREAFRRSRKT